MTSSASTAFAYFLFLLAAYNLFKLPWYLGLISIPSYGLEASMPFHSLIGYRGSKLWSHPVLFLAPHTIMGSSLLILYALHVLGKDAVSSKFYFSLAILFAIHVIPERAGIPNRSKKLPLNEACIVTIFLGTGLVLAGLINANVGRVVVIVPCLGAPIMELLPVISFAVKKIKNPDYKGESHDGDTPLTRNMSGYSGLCPFAKNVDISTREYPSSKKKE